MEQVVGIAGFIATGAAWGLVWLGVVGLLHKDVAIVRQAGLVGLAFAIFGTVFVLFQLYGLYAEYSTGSEARQEVMKAQFTGAQWWAHWGKLIIAALPFMFWMKRLRVTRLLIATVGICYVLLAYYDQIVSRFI